MAAMFDLRDFRDVVAYPLRFIFRSRSSEIETHGSRTPLVMRWRRGDDGKLESRWERDE